MDFGQWLQLNRIPFREIPKWGTYLRGQWEKHFVGHMSLEEKKAIYLYNDRGACGYLWHVFSYEKRGRLEGDKAVEAFLREAKGDCFVFFQHHDDAYIVKRSDLLTVEILQEETDVYVVDRDFSWTFVITHETGWCGPYFSRKKDKSN